MLSNSLANVVTFTMSQANNSQAIRRKPANHSSATSFHSSHKLKKISSSSTYVVDNNEKNPPMLKKIQSKNSHSMFEPDTSYLRPVNKLDKTTSSTVFNGRKSWNTNANASKNSVPRNIVIQEDNELVSLLTKQLYLAELQAQKTQTILKMNEEQIKSKNQEIGQLRLKIKDWETKSRNLQMVRKREQQQRRREAAQSEDLYKRCLGLEQKIFEMEKFLADYGLVWIGDTGKVEASESNDNNYIETYYEQIVANIDQLNLAAGKDEVQICHNEKGSGATFKTTKCMVLKFYKNGITVENGPLRSYNDTTTISFLRDILDGYFPSELQETYPNGVPFKVEDCRTQCHFDDITEFPGHGYRLGKQVPSNNRHLSITVRKPSNASQRSLKLKTADTSSSEMCVLRSQILASHNNICSDTHLQSHINAEISSNTKREKRDVPSKNIEFDQQARSLKSKGTTRFPSARKCYHSSTDRSERSSPNQFDCTRDRVQKRSRSVSLSRGRSSPTSKPISRVKGFPETNISSVSGLPHYAGIHDTSIKTRNTSLSAHPRNPAPPILHQINEPSGTNGELRLKVRSLNGGTIYLVHASTDDSVARLYQLLDKAMSRTVPRTYKIVLSGYSPRRLDHLGLSLKDSGITTDSVLHLVNV